MGVYEETSAMKGERMSSEGSRGSSCVPTTGAGDEGQEKSKRSAPPISVGFLVKPPGLIKGAVADLVLW